jgi:hypothetical protein
VKTKGCEILYPYSVLLDGLLRIWAKFGTEDTTLPLFGLKNKNEWVYKYEVWVSTDIM